jgi:hypothetical protein
MAITQQISNKLGTLVFTHVGFLYIFFLHRKENEILFVFGCGLSLIVKLVIFWKVLNNVNILEKRIIFKPEIFKSTDVKV